MQEYYKDNTYFVRQGVKRNGNLYKYNEILHECIGAVQK